MDEARIGQKGRVAHRWYEQGVRPPGIADKRFQSTFLYAAVRPKTGEDFALVLPEVGTVAMSEFLLRFGDSRPPGVHVVLALDQAGWHGANDLIVPGNVTLLPLLPYSPQLNPVERVWLYLRERFLSHRLHQDYEAIVDAACKAWNRLRAETGRMQSLCAYPWLTEVDS